MERSSDILDVETRLIVQKLVESSAKFWRGSENEELIKLADDTRQLVRQTISEVNEFLAGNNVEENSKSININRGNLPAMLVWPDASCRIAALRHLAEQRDFDTAVVEQCEKMWMSDDSALVRRSALAVVSEFYSRTKNPRIAGMLVSAIENAADPIENRGLAYLGLLKVMDRFDVIHRVAASGRRFDFGEDVDWEVVSRAKLT